MNNWDFVKENNLLRNGKGASDEEIISAEKKLEVKFASDYKELLIRVGACMFNGHELTGICQYPEFDTVAKTIAKRKEQSVPNGWYVIEDTHVDDIVIWQDAAGAIYQSKPGLQPSKISDSLMDYIKT